LIFADIHSVLTAIAAPYHAEPLAEWSRYVLPVPPETALLRTVRGAAHGAYVSA